jgi:hypothetical protein
MLKDPETYLDYTHLLPLFDKAKMVIDDLNLSYVEELLLSDVLIGSDDETWFKVKVKDGKQYYRSNSADEQQVEILSDGKEVSWLLINLFDSSWSTETKINRFLESKFDEVIKYAKDLPGVNNLCVHIAKPNTLIQAHCDYSSDDNFMNLVMVLRADGSLLTVDKQKHSLDTGKIFLFDASYEHSVDNAADVEFIVLALRIYKNFIK